MTLPIPAPFVPGVYPDPADVPQQLVCCQCKRAVVVHFFRTGDFVNKTHHCVEHGDITPMLSAVVNGRPYVPDWSAA